MVKHNFTVHTGDGNRPFGAPITRPDKANPLQVVTPESASAIFAELQTHLPGDQTQEGWKQPQADEMHYAPKALQLKKLFDFWTKNKQARYLYVILQDNGNLDCHVLGNIHVPKPETVEAYWRKKGFTGQVIAAFDLERHFDTQLEEAGIDPKALMCWERFRATPLNGIIRQAALPAPTDQPFIMGPKKPTLVIDTPQP